MGNTSGVVSVTILLILNNYQTSIRRLTTLMLAFNNDLKLQNFKQSSSKSNNLKLISENYQKPNLLQTKDMGSNATSMVHSSLTVH